MTEATIRAGVLLVIAAGIGLPSPATAQSGDETPDEATPVWPPPDDDGASTTPPPSEDDADEDEVGRAPAELAAPPPPPPGYDEALPAVDPPAPPEPPNPAAARPLPAPRPEPPPKLPGHDGFFLRVALGLGYQTMESGDEGISGGVFSGGVSVGFTPFENVALHGGFLGVGSFAAGYRGSVAALDGNDAFVSATAVTAGATYFVMPQNIYLSANLGVARASIDVEDDETTFTDIGFAALVILGKEWWLNPEWGVGAAIQLLYMNLGGPGVDDVKQTRWNVAGATLGVSTTFN